MTDQTCQKWFAKFCAGDLSLDVLHSQSGRPGAVGSNQIETVFDNNQRCTTQKIASTLKTSKSIVTGGNENCVLYFTEKTTRTFWPPHVCSLHTVRTANVSCLSQAVSPGS